MYTQQQLQQFENSILNIDCLDFLKQCPDDYFDLVVTSPPYNLNINYNSYNDNLSYEKYLDFCNKWIKLAFRVLKSCGRIAINIPIETKTNLNDKKFIVNDYMNLLKNNGFIEMAFILWDKQHLTSRTAWGSFNSPSCPNILQPMECILVYCKDSKIKKKSDKDMQTDLIKEEFIQNTLGVWRIQPEKDRTHPAPFPIELPSRLIKMFSYVDDIVLDCFSGSGTTAIACHNLKRRFICIEKDKDYYEKSIKRLNSEKMKKKLF